MFIYLVYCVFLLLQYKLLEDKVFIVAVVSYLLICLVIFSLLLLYPQHLEQYLALEAIQ